MEAGPFAVIARLSTALIGPVMLGKTARARIIRTHTVRKSCSTDNYSPSIGERPIGYYRKVNLTYWVLAILVAAICWIIVSQLL